MSKKKPSDSAAELSQDLRNLKLTFKLDSGFVQEITLEELAEQPFLAMGKHHGLNRDLSRLSIADLISRFRIRNMFDYMFRVRSSSGKLPFTAGNVQAMKDLGRSMLDLTLTGDLSDPAVNDSTIDSGYVYFGQFVDHDITRDNSNAPDVPQDARQIPNVRTPNLDLDAVYGRGPALDAHLYDGIKMKLTPALPGPPGKIDNTGMITDLPRAEANPTTGTRDALIGDDRNDENLIVQHLHIGFLAFHNAVIDALKQEHPGAPNAEIFIEAQREVRRHYQWVLLNDFLRTMCGSLTVDDVLQHGVKFYKNRRNVFTGQPPIPVEFSVACYRFGHSMIRDRYNFNDNFLPPSRLSNFSFAFLFTGQGGQAGTDKHPAWRINWNRFFSSPGHPAQNKARRIDTRVALHMGQLPGAADPGTNFMAWLSARNLVRALSYGLPTGQAVAQLMGATPLTVAQLKSNPFENALFAPVYAQGVTPGGLTGGPAGEVVEAPSPLDPAVPVAVQSFPLVQPVGWEGVAQSASPEQQALHEGTLAVLSANNDYLCKSTPLWYYILKEAEVLEKGNRLGPIGGRIVTEVFVRLLLENPDSILNNPAWKPRFGVDANGCFRIFDLLKFAGRIPAQDPL